MKNFFGLHQYFTYFLIALSLSACVSKQEALERDARQFSEIAVTHPDFNPQPGEKFAWFSPIIWSSEALPQTPELRQLLTNLVEEQLRAKGYQMVAAQSEADYVIGAAIVDKDNQGGEALRGFFQLFPSLNQSRAGLPQSMALIGVTRPQDVSRIGEISDGSSIALWRAAISAFVLGENVPREVRLERFQSLATKLMETMP